MHIGRQFGSQLLQSWQRDIGNSHLSTHASSNTRSSFAYRSTAQYQNTGWFYTRHTSHQLTFSTFRLLQIVGSILRSHSACHLTHRYQQRQGAVVALYRFVGYADSTTLQHGMRQFLFAGKMEIGEYHLAFAHQRVFWLDGLLHLDYHVSLRIDILDGRHNLGAHLLIGLIAEATTLACRMLHQHLMASAYQLGNTRRGHAHSVLVVFNLLGNSYFHNLQLLVIKP